MNRLLTRLVTAAAASGAIAAAQPAFASAATTYCVHEPGSACAAGAVDEGADLAAALMAAQGVPATAAAPNVIQIGAGSFSPINVPDFVYGSTNPIRIVGAGEGATTLNASATASGSYPTLELGGTAKAPAALSVSDLTVNAQPLDSEGIMLNGASADHVAVNSGASRVIGVALWLGRLTNSVVTTSGFNSTAVLGAQPSGASGPDDNLVADSTLTGATGVEVVAGLTEIHRVTVHAQGTAVWADGGPAYIDDSLLLTAQDGLDATSGGSEGSINALNDTVVHTGSRGGNGAFSDDVTGNGADVSLTNSIVNNFSTALATNQDAGTASIEGSFNDYDAPNSGALINDSGSTFDPPGFVNAFAGDYHLASNSPLIDFSAQQDLGSLSSTTDLDGNPRVVMIDHASTPVDLGAYEHQLPATTTGPTTTTTTATTTTATTTTATTTTTTPTTTTTATTTTPTTTTPPGAGGTPHSGIHAAAATLRRAGGLVAHSGRITLRLQCSGSTTCAGVRVVATLGGHTVATARVTVRATRVRTVVLKLNRTGRRLLAQRGHARVAISVSYLRSGRRVSLRHAAITLRAPRG